jgi:mRNA interferase RelE/StbE
LAEWTWTFSKQASKDFKVLDKKLQKKIRKSLDQLVQQSPSCDVCKLKGEDNLWRLKLGNWRILFTKEHEVFRVLVIEIVRRTTTTY